MSETNAGKRVSFIKTQSDSFVTKGIMKKPLFIFLLLSISSNVFAEGFAKTQSQLLESQIQKKYSPDILAKKLTETHVDEQWTGEFDQDLALYIAMKWLEQNNVSVSASLLNKVDPARTQEDLWNYYRAQSYLSLNQFEKAAPFVNTLEGKLADDEDVVILKSSYLVYADQLIPATELMDHFIKNHKKSGFAYFQRAYLRMLGLSHSLAMEDFKLAIKYLPKNEVRLRQQASLQIGLIYSKFYLDEKKADQWLKKGIAMDPNSALAQQVKAQVK
jgi:tetratricopeptide (TPR) repeat protein